MATFKTIKDTFLLAHPDPASERLALVPSGTTFTGEREGNFIRTRIPDLSPHEGFVPLMDVSAVIDRQPTENKSLEVTAAAQPAVAVDELARLWRAAHKITSRGSGGKTKSSDTSTFERHDPFVGPGGGGGTGTGSDGGSGGGGTGIGSGGRFPPRAYAPYRPRDMEGVIGKRAATTPVEVTQAQPVEFSAFSPASVERGGEALVQIFVHRSEQAAEAAVLARESDPETTRRGVATLDVEVAIGQRIDIFLEADGAKIDTPAQYLIWRGEPRACQFVLSVPTGEQRTALTVRTIVSVNGGPAGSLRFRLPLVDRVSAADAAIGIKGDAARQFGRAFLSYASQDRAEVLKRAQALKALHIDFFQDLLSLEPGERWEQRLYEEIDKCNLFILFWSHHASVSKWVIAETERALARHAGDESAPPDIVPIVLEGPPVPARPESLKSIQMDDWLRYVIAAVEASPPQSPGTKQ